MDLIVMVLAGGRGTRNESALPQVIHPVAGRPMVGYSVDAARSLEPTDVVVIVDHSADDVRAAVGPGITYVTQGEQRGTGHAAQQAAPVTAGRAGTVLVLFGDTPLILPETLRQLVDHHVAQEAAVTILAFHPSDPTGYGRVLRDTDTGRVLGIVQVDETTPQPETISEVDSGIICFADEWLWPSLARLHPHASGEIRLSDLVAIAAAQGEPVCVVSALDQLGVMRVDNRLKLARAEAEMRRRINERWMLSGVTLIHPEATCIEATVEIGTDTVIWPNCLLQGGTRVGQGCTIGPGSVIRDSTIGDRCRVELSVVEQATMEEGSNLGPFGHLRSGAHLGPGVHMGNYGEVKNSYLGPGVKMGHFSYIGDAVVGAGANIGAGSITCNFDGERKHRTVIGQGAFIGSDAMLIAPVEIGEGARIGAGSVVTHDVPPGSVAYGVPARVRSGTDVGHSEVDGRDGG